MKKSRRAAEETMAGSTLVALLLLLSNDIEQNPGPINVEKKQEKLEKHVTDLQKDVKSLRKVVETLVSQVDVQNNRERPKMANLLEEVNIVKETTNIQVSQSKRLKSDIATLEYDLAALKKVGAQQRNDLKSIGNLIMSELKSLREKTLEQEESLSKECRISTKFTTDLPVMVTSIRVVGSGLAELKNEVNGLRSSTTFEVNNMATAVDNLDASSHQMKAQIGTLESENVNLRESVLEQMTSINESVEAQTGLLKLHDLSINQISDDTKSISEKLEGTIERLDEKMASIDSGLTGRVNDLFTRLDQMTGLVETHEAVSQRLTAQLETLNHEFRGVLQTVDDQVNANQMRLESMVAMASDKASHMRKELETRSMEDRRLFNLELRNQSDKVVHALQKVSLRLDELDGMYDDMQERLYEVDKSRKNNLLFYGIPQHNLDEDPDETERLVKSVITTKLQVRRELVLTKATRLWNGPSFRGLKPILVTFHLFKDKEDILRKSPLLRGTNMYITEDYSRKVRRHREELLKFAKLMKSRANVKCLLQYDRLYVDNECYLYNEIEQRVQKVLMKIPETDVRGASAPTQSRLGHHRDLGLPTEAFEQDDPSSTQNCCVHCEGHQKMSRPESTPSYSNRRPQSRPYSSEDECISEYEASIVEPLNNRGDRGGHSHHSRMSSLEVVEEENSTGTTPSPSYLPDIHQHQKSVL